jgi:hypothetical protein
MLKDCKESASFDRRPGWVKTIVWLLLGAAVIKIILAFDFWKMVGSRAGF